MTRVDSYKKHVIAIPSDTPVARVAQLMLREEVGSVVVLTDDETPAGIVTDRDLTLRVIAEEGATPDLPVASVMSHPLVEVKPTDPIDQVVDVMRSYGIRRVPVVREKKLVGLLSLDDLLVHLARELDDLSQTSTREIQRARRVARAHEVRRELEDGLYELIGHIERIGDRALESVVGELEGIRNRLRKLFE